MIGLATLIPETLLYALTLLGGLVTLAIASNFLVQSTVSIGSKLGIPQLIVGVFIVGFGTSVPEILVVVDAVVSGYSDVAVGTIVGSNIANLWFVLVVPALITSIPTDSPNLKFAFSAMVLVTLIWLITTALMPVTSIIGVIFIALLIVYAIATYEIQKRSAIIEEGGKSTMDSVSLTVGMVILSLILLPIGANFIIDGGVGLAKALSVPEEIIGLTLVAVGTSLPEIGAGVAAALQKRPQLIIGNVVGSNIFNILGAGGVAALFLSYTIPPSITTYSHWMLAIAPLTLLPFVVFSKPIGKRGSLVLLLLYVMYVIGLVLGARII